MKLATQLLINLALTAAIARAALYGDRWAINVTMFYAGLTAVLALCTIIVLKEIAAKPATFPPTASYAFDFMQITLVVMSGWFWCAAALTFGMFTQFALNEKRSELRSAT